MPTPVKVPARVVEILSHAEDLRSFVLRPERHVPVFLPGQFLHLALDPWDPGSHWPESRVFSIASSPRRRDRLRVTVSRKGAFTIRMFEELRVESQVWLKLPYGVFCPDVTWPGTMVLLAGGSGVTPFVSFLEAAALDQPEARIELHYGARTPALLIYREPVEQCRRQLRGLRTHLFAEQVPEAERDADVTQGLLSARRAWEALERPEQARYYLSGPKPMIDSFRSDLLSLGAKPEAVLSDEWA